jgi:hypothetical protein
LSNVSIKGGDNLYIKALSLSILSSTYIEMDESVTFEIEDTSNINDSVIKTNKNRLVQKPQGCYNNGMKKGKKAADAKGALFKRLYGG